MSPPASSLARPPHDARADVWAGAATALIFHVEYLGLGAHLGEALLPGMPGGAALGAMLVIVPVVACSLFALASRGATLAGPRAASTAAAVAFLPILATAHAARQGDSALLLAVITASAALTLLVGRAGSIRRAMASAPRWLVQGFMVATALGIVSGGACAGPLWACQQVDPVDTWVAYLPPVVLGIGCKPLLSRLHGHAARCGGPASVQRALAGLQPLGLFAAVAASWTLFEVSGLSRLAGPSCGRLGEMPMDWSLLAGRWHSVTHDVCALPARVLMEAVLCGVVVGAVLILESLTAFVVDGESPAHVSTQPRMLAACAAGCMLAAAVGGAPASFSTSRTVALRLLGGHSWRAVVVHGVALLGIATLASPWAAQLPKLSAAVALTLVGVQMLGRDSELLWQRGYHPGASAPRQREVVLFYVMLGVSVWANNALIGFVVLAVSTILRVQGPDRLKRMRLRPPTGKSSASRESFENGA